jgi:single-strand DNA-binding protein
MLPQTTAIGNVKRPELRYSQTGKAIHSFTLECSEKKPDGTYDNCYLKVTTFDKTAEFVNQYFNEGSVAVVTGSLQTTSWEKDGKKNYETTFKFPNVTFAPKDRSGNQERQTPQVTYEKHTDYRTPAPVAMPANTTPSLDMGEEIPF